MVINKKDWSNEIDAMRKNAGRRKGDTARIYKEKNLSNYLRRILNMLKMMWT